MALADLIIRAGYVTNIPPPSRYRDLIQRVMSIDRESIIAFCNLAGIYGVRFRRTTQNHAIRDPIRRLDLQWIYAIGQAFTLGETVQHHESARNSPEPPFWGGGARRHDHHFGCTTTALALLLRLGRCLNPL